ncbi:hypothetical protein LEP1GSC151_0065 [Leptospira interrogans serovar Grippotyphosa str. LT2186]|uniref:Uncharacterized protein n=1 Tax=Leptospira interrogans serovar Grippotyphosa str. LT2186 TaxID=1001599 RepID=M3HD25_LEPIR|nr:hypothetical protein LEP1GSC151_0065 [Leptospira interrogans serovar Grippotyphosa str. LT2186]
MKLSKTIFELDLNLENFCILPKMTINFISVFKPSDLKN